MSVSPLAGTKAPREVLINVDQLIAQYYDLKPDASNPLEAVSFGTSGHRGSSESRTFNEAHVLSISQAICEYRRMKGIDGPLYVGKDTHALSGPAQETALEVLAANDVNTIIEQANGFTPTPAISRAILAYNEQRKSGFADGIVITPSHNPPADGGFKYNPPGGGPADTDITGWIQDRANALLLEDCKGVKRKAVKAGQSDSSVREGDLAGPYIDGLKNVVNLEVIRSSGISIGVDPLGGASVHYWPRIAEKYHLNLKVVNPAVDPTFSFMTLDHDGKIRMDCSSPYAMAGLLALKDQFRLAFGNDPDADRHGIVTPGSGLMNPNHFLAVAIGYLLATRDQWSKDSAVGKTLVSSSLIDRVVSDIGRKLMEAPVGFKWFAPGLLSGAICFGGEESAGASFLRLDGGPWATDKDGIIMDLLAAEITAQTEKDPGEHFQALVAKYGMPFYTRIDAPANQQQKDALKKLDPSSVAEATLAGEPIKAKLNRAPGNDELIGGLKVVAEHGWFAARPSGTENIYKIYAESFKSQSHLDQIVIEAQAMVDKALGH